jgi:hypothetical protein
MKEERERGRRFINMKPKGVVKETTTGRRNKGEEKGGEEADTRRIKEGWKGRGTKIRFSLSLSLLDLICACDTSHGQMRFSTSMYYCAPTIVLGSNI